MKNGPIGIFDSGIGGLTVVKQIMNVLPNESILYLGDTARVPYGNRDEDTITTFAKELTAFLLDRKVKVLVIACNTISAISFEEIKSMSPVPVIGVVKSTAFEAVSVTRNKKIGVIGTMATINSMIYEKEIAILSKDIEVNSQACPLFVPLVEEGLLTHPATRLIAKDYLTNFNNSKIDTLILGCTHYPLLSTVIQKTIGNDVQLVDSAKPTANELKEMLINKNLLKKTPNPEYTFLLTDKSDRTDQTVNLFLGSNYSFKKVVLK